MRKESIEASKGRMMIEKSMAHWAPKVFLLVMHLLPSWTVLKSRTEILAKESGFRRWTNAWYGWSRHACQEE